MVRISLLLAHLHSRLTSVFDSHLAIAADAMDDKLKTIDDIDEELTELEDMVEQLEQYTGSLRTCLSMAKRNASLTSRSDLH